MYSGLMVRRHGWRSLAGVGACVVIAGNAAAQEKLHFTYLWHMEQPIYWPDRQGTNGALGDRYERLAESLARGGAHPENNLNDIFGNADRVAGYQYRMRDSISAFAAFPGFGSVPEGGAQISFSGGLIENIMSVAGTGFIGGQYGSGWYNSLREARGWSTTGGASAARADIVVFPFHHALMPLVDESAMRKEIEAYKAIYADAWGTARPISSGFFPSEMAFSERMIGVLADEGVQWSIVSGEKVSRACGGFPVVFGSGGINCDPPNRADQMNPAQSDWFRLSIDRGCAPAEAYPFAFTPHRARYVDPATGAVRSIVVVPASQSLGWKDGYSPQGIGDFDALNAKNDSSRPMLVVLAHDGDNAWGGGYSYYVEATPNRVSTARSAGYVETVVQRYLADHPVPAGDLVHVEDGAWVNADGDFGSPQMLNWNWPLLNSAGQIDIANGWHEDERNWAVITAMQNRVDTAEQIWRAGGGTVDARKIVYPETGANAVERAWHYFLGSLNSGYMYYGTSVDMEVKPTVACNNAARLADPVIVGGVDATGPTIWIPQRHPWNPGSVNFGPQYGYQQSVNSGDFWVWTFAYDVSGVSSVSLKYRVDADGVRSLSSTENETYGGGTGVGAWQTLAMNRRTFPAGNVYNNPTIDFFVMPQYIADEYSVQVMGLRSVLIDYYVEAVDSLGNVKRSPIQHVWIGDGSGATGGGGGCSSGVVTTSPCPPVAGQQVTISYDAAGRNLSSASAVAIHLGYNGWTNVIAPDPVMTRAGSSGPWMYTYTVPAAATVIDCVFNNGSGTWDNNSGTDWHISVQAGTPVSGRCCVGGLCSVVTQSACAGAFTANGTCDAACPADPAGACCVAGGCTSVMQASCSGVWSSGVACSPSPCAFVMDGNADGDTTIVAQNGAMWVRAAVRGDVLYLAAPNTPGGNDRFVYLAPASGPGAMRSANWAKAGQVAGWGALLGAEADNSYVGWQDQAAGAAAAAAKGAVVEGTINLRQQFGLAAGAPLPESVWVAFAQFGTADGAALVPSLQAPASLDGDGSVQAGEFVRVRLCTLGVGTCCAADFDGNGTLAVADIFAYLNAWFAGDLRTDFDGNGTPAVADIFAYLNAWFAGC
jgi:hypothetical protein